jgi:hypothetical protein
MIRRIMLLWILGVFTAGCGQPLRTLMELGREQDALQECVVSRSAFFTKLLRDIEEGALAPGTARPEIIRLYGTPVLERGGVLLYRHPAAFFEGPKVYLELDAAGRLENIRVVERSGS